MTGFGNMGLATASSALRAKITFSLSILCVLAGLVAAVSGFWTPRDASSVAPTLTDTAETTERVGSPTPVAAAHRFTIAPAPGAPPKARTWPRIKPMAAARSEYRDPAMRVGQKTRAQRPPAGIALQDDFTGADREGRTLLQDFLMNRAARRTEQAYETAVVIKGIPVPDLLMSLGARASDLTEIQKAAEVEGGLDQIPPGAAVEYAFDTIFVPTPVPESPSLQRSDGDAPETSSSISFVTAQEVLARVRYRTAPRTRVTIWREADGSYSAQTNELKVEKRYATSAGIINRSLFAAADKAGLPPETMSQFANLFLYDIDFARDIHRGDRFEVVYEVFYDSAGEYVGTGNIIFAGMEWNSRNESRTYFRFDAPGYEEAPYFDDTGESSTRLLMKTPIEGARVTSGFGKRRHPILGYSKSHKGVDFGAPRGTPIMAAGDGVIERAAPTGTFGNYVKIIHDHGYATAYAHMDRFASGIVSGSRVRQGQIIGYVGSTGRSTGPHLHYEVHRHGDVKNPMNLEVANGRILDETRRAEFLEARDRINGTRLQPYAVALNRTP